VVSSSELHSVTPRFKPQSIMRAMLIGFLRELPHFFFRRIVCPLCQAGSRWNLTVEARLQFRLSPYDVCSGTGRARSNPVFPCLYHSTIASPPFLHLSPTTYKKSQPMSASLNNKYCSVQRQNMPRRLQCTSFRIPS